MDLLDIRIRADTSGADKATSALDKTTDAAGRTGRATAGLAQTFKALGPLVGAAMAAFSIKTISEQADAWAELQARAVNAVGSMEGGIAVMGRLEKMARSTYSSLGQTAESWLSNATNLSAMGVSVEKQLDLVQSLNDAMVISATRGQKAESVLRGWSNAMTLGTLRGNDLNAVLTGSDRLAQALADSMGVNVTELRSLGAQGKITREQLLGVTSQMEKLSQEASDMPATLADARTIWGNTLTAVVGLMDQAFGASEALAGSFIGLADRVRAGAEELIHWATVATDMMAPAFDLIGAGLEAVSSHAGIAVAALAGFFAPAVLAGLASVSVAIGTTMVAAVRALGAALLTNPLGLFVAIVAGAIAAAYQFRDEIRQAIGVDFVAIIESSINKTVGVFVGGYEAIRAEWRNLPAVVGDLAVQAGQALVDGIVAGLAIASQKIREWYSWVSPLGFGMKMLGFDLGEIGGDDIRAPSIHNPWEGRAASTSAGIAGIFNDALSRNYIEDLGGIIAGTRSAEDAAYDLSTAVAAAGTTMDQKASKGAKKLEETYRRLVDSAQDFVRQQELEASLIGMTEQAANALRYEFDLLNDARRAGITLTDADKAGFKALAEAMAEAEERTRSLTERFEFMKDITKGVLTDIRSNIISNMQQGMSFWEAAWRSMGTAAVNALNKIVDKLLNDVIDAIFQVNQAGQGFGGGGGLLGFLGGLFGGGGASPYLAFSQTGQYLFDGGGTYLGSNVVPFGPDTRRIGAGVLGDSGFGPQHFPAVLKKGESVLTADHMNRTMRTINGLAANQNHANQNRGVSVKIENYGTSKDFEVEQISPDEVRIIARDEAVKVAQANNKARQKHYQAGGQFG